MGTASQALATFAADLRFADLPPAVVSAATRHLSDAIGVALAAAARGEAHAAVEMTRSWAGATEARVIGSDLSAPAAAAAFVNGALTHALEYDDTHGESGVHPSAVVMPVALAVGEEVGASGAALITAAVGGYEVAARIGAAAPGRFHERGLHTTGVAGPFAAAATAGALWGLTETELAHALGIAGAQSAGLLAALAEGTDAKRLQPGWAARAGIVGADLARRGETGPASILEGPSGVYDALLHGEQPDLDRLAAGLGSTWETLRMSLKPYPACDYLHALMDAAAEVSVKWADIEEIECAIAPAAVSIVAEPRTPRLHPETTHAAQYSLPFAVAAAIVGGRTGMDLFGEDARRDRRILTLAERVHHRADPTLDFPASYGGSIRINTRAGRTLEHVEAVNRGHPDRPMSTEQVRAKFEGNAAERLGPERAARALVLLDDLANLESVETLARALGA